MVFKQWQWCLRSNRDSMEQRNSYMSVREMLRVMEVRHASIRVSSSFFTYIWSRGHDFSLINWLVSLLSFYRQNFESQANSCRFRSRPRMLIKNNLNGEKIFHLCVEQNSLTIKFEISISVGRYGLFNIYDMKTAV